MEQERQQNALACEQKALARARGATIGASIMGGFGGVWLFLGLLSAGLPWVVAAGLGLSGLAGGVLVGSRLRRALPLPVTEPGPEKRRMDRWFHVVNVVQWIAIFLAALLLRRAGQAEWIVPAVGAIVGLHFLPLARIFGSPSHRWTGLAMMGWVAACAPIASPARDAAVATGLGLILWASAAYSLRAAARWLAASGGFAPALAAGHGRGGHA
jgi:hypothetical protein